jgi:SM-20-related protein
MGQDLVKTDEEIQFEALVQGLIEREFGVCDNFLETFILDGLRDNLLRYQEAGEMHQAGVGRKFDHQKNALVRGDQIKWMENISSDSIEQLFFSKIERFIIYLNQTCYTGLNDFEFHYANYLPGSFYKRHLDQFKSNKGRKYSIVLYLNKDWGVNDGGYLTLYLNGVKEEIIYPYNGRLVFFKSDELEHEVHPSFHRNRISVAGWLKS